jgi:4-amino-4-deoxy-L-arabinose transferase-like glycosyltransferase
VAQPAPTHWRRLLAVVWRPTTLGAVAVIAVAVLLRAVALDFALPMLTHPDEPTTVRRAALMSDNSDWNPHHFNYPSMLFDVVAVFTRVYDWVNGQPGSVTASIDMQNIGVGLTTKSGVFLALRALTAVLSVAMCLLAYWVVLRVTGRVLAALLAGLLLAVSPVAIINGLFITPDTYSGVFTAIALLGAVGIVRRGRRLDYAIAGVGLGLAATSKYNAAVVAVPVIVAHLIRHRASAWRRPEVVLSGVTAVVTFVLLTPAAILDFDHVAAGVTREARHYAGGHGGWEGGAFWYYLSALRPDTLLLAGACLSVLCLRSRHRREVAVVLSFAAAYGALLSFQYVRFARNLLPIMPALAMLAGFTAAVGADQLGRLPRSLRTVLAAAATAVVTVGLAVAFTTAVGASQRLEERPRLEALQWLTAHVPVGSRVVVERYGPYIPRGRYRLTRSGFVVAQPNIPPDTAAVVVTELGSGRYLSQPHRYSSQVAGYRALRSQYCLAGRWTDGPWVEVLTPCGPGHR